MGGGGGDWVLYVAAIGFAAFGVAELVFALHARSLSLLGDALAALVDAATCLLNALALARARGRGGEDAWTRAAPAASAAALFATVVYVSWKAARELAEPGEDRVASSVVLVFGLVALANDASLVFLLVVRGGAPLRGIDPASTDVDGGLNVRSALVHVLADTCRSLAIVASASIELAVPALPASRVDAAAALAAQAPVLWMCADLAAAIYGRLRRATDPAAAPLVEKQAPPAS